MLRMDCDSFVSRDKSVVKTEKNYAGAAVPGNGSVHYGRLAVHQAMEYLRENPAQSCEKLAGRVFLNPDYLTRLFKEETGQTLIEYATALRLDEAKNLLENSSLRIGEIANRLSYHNFSYFSKMFKEKTGVTPNQYRQGRR